MLDGGVRWRIFFLLLATLSLFFGWGCMWWGRCPGRCPLALSTFVDGWFGFLLSGWRQDLFTFRTLLLLLL